jgi:hypothetical protein
LPLYLVTLHGAQKCCGKQALSMAFLNTLGPDPSGLRLYPSRSSRPPRRWFHVHGWDYAPSCPQRCRWYVWGSDRALSQPGRSRVEKPSDEEAILMSEAPWVTFYPPSLGLARGRIEALTRCNRQLSACCTTAVLRMLFSCWYTLPTSLVEGVGNTSRSAAAAVTF